MHPEFFTHPFLESIRHAPRWTISDTKKRPVDIRKIMAKEKIVGAEFHDERCLAPLDEIHRKIPNQANAAFYLMHHVDNLMVLDIENTCPPHIAAALLRISNPKPLYAELSRSGTGYHLVFERPENIADFPHVLARKKMQEPKTHYYEILMEHYVTFTGIPIPADRYIPTTLTTPTWNQLFASLALQMPEPVDITLADFSDDVPAPPAEDSIMSVVRAEKLPFTFAHYHNDHSSFEYAAATFLIQKIRQSLLVHATLCRVDNRQAVSWTADQIAMSAYHELMERLPHRAKHDEFRNSVPLLLNTVRSAMQRNNYVESYPFTPKDTEE